MHIRAFGKQCQYVHVTCLIIRNHIQLPSAKIENVLCYMDNHNTNYQHLNMLLVK